MWHIFLSFNLDGIVKIADVEITVYLGILDTRKYFGSQKILTKITAILSWILLWWEKCGNFVVKIALWEMFCPKIFNIEGLNNIFCRFSMKIKIFYNINVTLPHKILHFYAYLMLSLRSWVLRCRRNFFISRSACHRKKFLVTGKKFLPK